MTQDNSALDTDQLIMEDPKLNELIKVLNMQKQMGEQLGMPIDDDYGNPLADSETYTCCSQNIIWSAFIRLLRC